jgi:hypothetical protein
MMFPVYQIVESLRSMKDRSSKVKSLVRVCIVVTTVLVSLVVPNFGLFISLIGASCCSLLMFIFPALLHLKLCCTGHALGGYSSIRPDFLDDDDDVEDNAATGGGGGGVSSWAGPKCQARCQRCFNYMVIVLGIVGGVLGTTDAAREMLQHYHHESHVLEHHQATPGAGHSNSTTGR